MIRRPQAQLPFEQIIALAFLATALPTDYCEKAATMAGFLGLTKTEASLGSFKEKTAGDLTRPGKPPRGTTEPTNAL